MKDKYRRLRNQQGITEDRGFPGVLVVKKLTVKTGDIRETRRKWQLTPVFLPGESHGQDSLAGYSPRVTKSQT